MEDEISCDDPQFMSMLETCLSAEIDAAKVTLSDLASEKKGFRVKILTQLQTRKNLKEETKNAQENIAVLMDALDKYDKYSKQTTDKIELMKLNMDSDYKIMKMEEEQYESIVNGYEKTWQLYHDKYEAFPLAKVRKVAKIKLEKLQVNKMVLQFKIAESDNLSKLMQRISWLRLRTKIIALARAILNKMKVKDKLQILNNSIKNSEEKLKKIQTEFAVQLKRKEEEKKARALKVLEMPPPKINFSHMRTIYEGRPRSDFLDGWKRNYENSIDTLSVDTLIFEERCLGEEKIVRQSSQTSFQVEEEEDHGDKGQPIDATSPRLDQEQPEVEHEDVSSELDGNAGPGSIDAPDEEVEQRMEQELEHSKQLTGLSNDKRTGQHGEEDLVEEMNDLPVKRMRLIYDERKAVASPGTIKRLERKGSRMNDANADLSIRKIETVRYNMSSIRKMGKNAANAATDSRGTHFIHESPKPGSSRISLTSEINQDNPNPTNMFPLRNNDYSDSSVMSFCLYSNMNNLKADQMSLDGQSMHDLCECSNLSNLNEDTEMELVPESKANAASTSKTHNIPRNDKDTYKRITFERSEIRKNGCHHDEILGHPIIVQNKRKVYFFINY